MRRFMMLVLALSVCLVGATAFGQQETGQISGRVLDPQDRVVSGATVTLKSVSTGAERTATTDDQGNYLFANLQSGLYDMTVKSGQFAENTQRVQVTVGGKVSLDAKLSTQAIAADVQVVAAAGGVEVNTTDQQLSNVVTREQVRELPTITRNPYALVGISGNVSAGGEGRGTGYNINGQRSASTSILLDGVENVDNFTATVGQSVPLDSVQEFRVITGNFSAEYGRASGGIVNVGTISGGNEFHGTGYIFNRISKLASNGFNNNAFGIPRAVFTRNQFGYSIGGPIIKNKLFFFSNTEWIRIRSGGSRVAWVPTANFIAAANVNTRNFFAPYAIGGAAGPTISASQVLAQFGGAGNFRTTFNAPAENAFLTFANANPNAAVFQQVTYSTPRDTGGGTPSNEYQTVNRIDWNISSKTQLYGRYALQDQVFAEGTVAFSPYTGFSTGAFAFNQNFLMNLTRTISSDFISQTKLAFNRLNGGQPLGTQPIVPTMYMNPNRTLTLQGVPIALPGYLPFSPGNAIPFSGAQNVYQLNQDFSKTSGKHSWRFGGQIVHMRDNKTFGAYSYAVEGLGLTNGESFSNFLTGNLAQFSVAINPGGRFPTAPVPTTIPLPVGPPAFSRSNRYTEWAVYANDSIRYRPRLTLNFGLRYEYYGVQHNAQNPGLDANFYYGAGANIQERIRNGNFFVAANSPAGGLWRPDKNNFAPRLGFAWDINGDGKTSLRGGYGLAYERNFGNVTFNMMFNPPNYGVVALNSNTGVGGATIGDVPSLAVSIANYGPFSGVGPPRTFSAVSARHVDENIVNAYAHFWSLSFERQLLPNTVFSLEYSASAGRQLYSISDINRTGSTTAFSMPTITSASGVPGLTRLNPVVTSVNTRANLGKSNYHALIASLESNNFRNKGLSFTARYTFSGAKDNLSSTFSDTGQTFFLGFLDSFNPDLDYGYADFDNRHRFTTSFNYEPKWFQNDSNAAAKHLLGGWSLNGIVTMRSGYPFTIYDCSFASSTCARLMPTQAVTVNSNPPSTGDPNSFTYVNLDSFRNAAGAVITPAPTNGRNANYNFGPFPATMSRRNAFRGPGFWDVTLGLYKSIRFTERFRLQLRGEVFNVFNHANLFIDFGSPDVATGNVLAFRDGRRNVQLAAKLIF